MNWASNEDYTAAWGNQSDGQDTGYTVGHISSPIWTMSLGQAKKLTPMSRAVLSKKGREQDSSKGQFSALSNYEDEDNDNDTTHDSSGDEDRTPSRIGTKSRPNQRQ